MPFKFENLKIWQESLELTNSIHILTKSFPKDELFILTSQMKRAADSICLNIAEGSTGQSNAEQKRFIGYSQRSALEVVACFFIARKRNLVTENDFDLFYNLLNKLIAMIQKFKNSLGD